MRLFCQPNPARAHLFHALSVLGALSVSGVVLAMTEVGWAAVGLWLGLVLVAEVLTTAVNLHLASHPPPDEGLTLWAGVKTATSALQGLAYSAGPLLLYMPGETTSVLAPAWAILTVTVGIVYACAPWPPALYAMATATVLPAALGLFMIGGPIETALAVCMAIALPFTLVIGTMAIRTTGDLIRARLEVAGLLSRQTALTQQVTDLAADRTRFFSAASHDLRQPLQALGFYTTLLSTSDRREAMIPEVLPRMIECAEALDRQFNAILGVTATDAMLARSVPQPLFLDEVLERVGETFRPGAEAKGLALRQRQSGLCAMVPADVLERALSNLVANAVRYTETGGILLAARRREGAVEVIVADSGIGIPPDEIDRIFHDYVQLSNRGRSSQDSRQAGFGLGLSIVRRLSAGLGWRISVRSRVGHGSVFALRLPGATTADAALARSIAEGEQAFPRADQPAQPVLVVDDDPLVRDATARLLTSWNARFATVASARAAMAALEDMQRAGPVTVLVDHRLGDDTEGLDLALQMRQRWPDTVTPVLMTGDTDDAVLARARSLGILVLNKPIKPIRLRAALMSPAKRA